MQIIEQLKKLAADYTSSITQQQARFREIIAEQERLREATTLGKMLPPKYQALVRESYQVTERVNIFSKAVSDIFKIIRENEKQ